MKKSVLALFFALLFAFGSTCAERVETDYEQKLPEAAVIHFADELPEVLSPILTHPQLEGWSVLCGAYYHYAPNPDYSEENSLIAFEKADERLLVQAYHSKAGWKLSPIGRQALRPGDELYITCDAKARSFSIVYPISETEEICFETYNNVHALKSYTVRNPQTGEMLKVVPSAPGRRFDGDEKVTDLLYKTHRQQAEGEDFRETFALIRQRFLEIAADLELKLDIRPHLDEIEAEIAAGASADFCASRGEYLNGLLLSDYLCYIFMDPKDFIFFKEDGTCTIAGTAWDYEYEDGELTVSKFGLGYTVKADLDGDSLSFTISKIRYDLERVD